jgi:hypothetical protein
LRDRLDPFALSEAIGSQLTRIWGMRAQAPRPSWPRYGWLPTYRWNTYTQGPALLPDMKFGLERYDRIWRSDHTHQAA